MKFPLKNSDIMMQKIEIDKAIMLVQNEPPFLYYLHAIKMLFS